MTQSTCGVPRLAVMMSIHAAVQLRPFADALLSILDQTYRDFHLLVMLDGPQSPEILDHLTRSSDPRIEIHEHRDNQGLARSLNDLLAICATRGYSYLARMDADDISHPSRFSAQIQFLDEHPSVSVLGTACIEIDEDGRRLAEVCKPAANDELRRLLPVGNPFVHTSVMFRASTFQSGARYPDRYRTCEDYGLWIALQRSGYVFANLREPLVDYRRAPEHVYRRAGLQYAWPELRLRYSALRLPGLFCWRHLMTVLAIFIVKASPAPILGLCYHVHRQLSSTHRHPNEHNSAAPISSAGRLDRVFKRLFDITFAILTLVLCAPVLMMVAVAVKIESRGPILFRGRRLGRHGIPFVLLKFRSMQFDLHSTDCSVGRNDPRITRVGVVVRKLKIDELPQMWNVLMGDMSIVGPRPELLRYAEALKGEFAPILSIRPGLTDLASLRFLHVEDELGRENPDRAYEERVLPEKNRLRLEYVRTRTLWLDFRIVFATIGHLVASLVGLNFHRHVGLNQ